MVSSASKLSTLSKQTPWYRNHWPWLLMLGPTLVIIAGIFTMWLAFTREDAMVMDDYYQEGRAINQDLRRDQVAKEKGLSFTLDYDAQQGQLKGRVQTRHAPWVGALQLHFIHPTQPAADKHIVLHTDAAGDFTAPFPMLQKTRWKILLEDQEKQWRLTRVWLEPT